MSPATVRYSEKKAVMREKQDYHSRLDQMRKRALVEGVSLQRFWEIWNMMISHEITMFPESTATLQQFSAEKNLSRKIWPQEDFGELQATLKAQAAFLEPNHVPSRPLARPLVPHGPNAVSIRHSEPDALCDTVGLADDHSLIIPTGPRNKDTANPKDQSSTRSGEYRNEGLTSVTTKTDSILPVFPNDYHVLQSSQQPSAPATHPLRGDLIKSRSNTSFNNIDVSSTASKTNQPLASRRSSSDRGREGRNEDDRAPRTDNKRDERQNDRRFEQRSDRKGDRSEERKHDGKRDDRRTNRADERRDERREERRDDGRLNKKEVEPYRPGPQTMLAPAEEMKMADARRKREEEAKAYLARRASSSNQKSQQEPQHQEPGRPQLSPPGEREKMEGSPIFDRPGASIPGLGSGNATASRANIDVALNSSVDTMLEKLKNKVKESQKRKREVAVVRSPRPAPKVSIPISSPTTSARTIKDSPIVSTEQDEECPPWTKTQTCTYWARDRNCKYSASECRYLHAETISELPMQIKTCYYWAKEGSCSRSARDCKFLHAHSEVGVAWPPKKMQVHNDVQSLNSDTWRSHSRNRDRSVDEGQIISRKQSEIPQRGGQHMEDIDWLIANALDSGDVQEDVGDDGESEEEGEVRDVKRTKF